MRTLIFESYEAFQQRADKEDNGVSPEFAREHGYWQNDQGNKGCYNCHRCQHCIDCVDCTDCDNCARCVNCASCSGCIACVNYTGMRWANLDTTTDGGLVPIVPHIHQRIFELVQAPGALDMSNWHTCETTHCRAGWVVTLAGEKGRALESLVETEAAAMLIYAASSPIAVHADQFYVDNDEAMASMHLAAEQERALERQARESTLPHEPAT